MKNLILFLTLVNVTTLVVCASNAAESAAPEVRKTSVRSPSPASAGTPALVNSLQTSQDGSVKTQSSPIYSSRQPISSIDYSPLPTPHTSVYSHQISGGAGSAAGQPTAPTGGYLIALNANGGQATLMPTLLSNGATPVIMQYLPHNGQSNGIQYLQLIPTRPLIVPISPYLSPSPYTNYHTQPSQYASQTTPYSAHSPSGPYTSHPSASYSSVPASMFASGPPSSPNSPHTLTTAASSYASIPTTAYHPPTGPSNYANYQPTIQSPIGGYSTNVYSYFRPHSGVQMVQSPLDLSLNTNEYIPLQGESGYRRRP